MTAPQIFKVGDTVQIDLDETVRLSRVYLNYASPIGIKDVWRPYEGPLEIVFITAHAYYATNKLGNIAVLRDYMWPSIKFYKRAKKKGFR